MRIVVPVVPHGRTADRGGRPTVKQGVRVGYIRVPQCSRMKHITSNKSEVRLYPAPLLFQLPSPFTNIETSPKPKNKTFTVKSLHLLKFIRAQKEVLPFGLSSNTVIEKSPISFVCLFQIPQSRKARPTAERTKDGLPTGETKYFFFLNDTRSHVHTVRKIALPNHLYTIRLSGETYIKTVRLKPPTRVEKYTPE